MISLHFLYFAEERDSRNHMDTFSCRECGAALRRSKRRLFDRVRYLEAYRCHGCGARYHVTLASRLQLARWAKCPNCRYQGVKAKKRIDKIDRIRGGFFNFFHKIMGGQLYHCWFCRLQFYDLRSHHDDPRESDNWLKGGRAPIPSSAKIDRQSSLQ